MLVSLQGSYIWKWGAVPYDQGALYGPSASTSWACDRAIKCSLRSWSDYTWAHWDLTSDYIGSHCGAYFSWTVGDVVFGRQYHQKCCFSVCISYMVLLGQLRDHLFQCSSAMVVPCQMPPASRLTGTELGGVRFPPGACIFGAHLHPLTSAYFTAFSGRETWK